MLVQFCGAFIFVSNRSNTFVFVYSIQNFPPMDIAVVLRKAANLSGRRYVLDSVPLNKATSKNLYTLILFVLFLSRSSDCP